MIKFFIFPLSLILLISCKRTPVLREAEKEGLPVDFISFYEKFHQDSAYQMAHITFPLDGFPSQPDSVTIAQGFHWTADKWVMHKGSMYVDSLFTREFEVPMPGLVSETILQKDVPYGIYRRFYRRDDGWYLIFYSDMNRIQKTEK